MFLPIYIYIYIIHIPCDYTISECNSRADIAFLVDMSGSIEVEQHGHVINFIKGLAKQLQRELSDDTVRTSIVYFSDTAIIQKKLTRSVSYYFACRTHTTHTNTHKDRHTHPLSHCVRFIIRAYMVYWHRVNTIHLYMYFVELNSLEAVARRSVSLWQN